MSSDEHVRAVAHVLRRLTFGPFPGSTERLAEQHADVHDLVDMLIDRDPVPFVPPLAIDKPQTVEAEPPLAQPALGRHWTERMVTDEAAVHERMMWFWHTVFVSSTNGDKGNYLYLWHQLRMLHAQALGSLRDIAHAMIWDPALVYYLDGLDTPLESPNENLSRELLELFLLGRGHYDEADVRSGARILAGRALDRPTGRVFTIATRGRYAVETYLGRTGALDPDALVDTVLSQEAVAPHIVGRLWDHFIGGQRDPALLSSWSDAFRRSGYEIGPLLRTVFHSDEFLSARRRRPRSPLEWYCAMFRAAGLDHVDEFWLDRLGQMPYSPPNVAGWPDQQSWVTAGSLVTRGECVAQTVSRPSAAIGDDLVDDTLRWCGVFDAGDATRSALTTLARQVDPIDARRAVVLRAALLSPEFALA